MFPGSRLCTYSLPSAVAQLNGQKASRALKTPHLDLCHAEGRYLGLWRDGKEVIKSLCRGVMAGLPDLQNVSVKLGVH